MDDILTLVKEERFVAVTHRSITKYLDEQSQIHFRFQIKDKESSEPSKGTANQTENATQKGVTKPASTSSSSKPKGPIRPTNLFRKGSSIPMTGPGGPPRVTPSKPISFDYTNYLPKSDPVRPVSSYVPPQHDQTQSVHVSPACLSAASSPS